MTYNVFGGMLNLAQSVSQATYSQLHCGIYFEVISVWAFSLFSSLCIV